jgi:ComF family protein
MHIWNVIRTQALHDFNGHVRDNILAVKYRNKRQYSLAFAKEMASYLLRSDDVSRYDAITWAPTSAKRRQERGVDQSELIARHLGALIGVRTVAMLRKITTAPQTGSTRAERLSQVEFVSRVPSYVKTVIVVDDVITTGATMRAASNSLTRAGVTDILCLAYASTQGAQRMGSHLGVRG